MRGIDTTNRLSTGENAFEMNFNVEPLELFGPYGSGVPHILDQIKEEEDHLSDHSTHKKILTSSN
jgi:hypothetical protein